MQPQRLHHLCVKIKNAFNSRHPRTFVKDVPLFRSVLDILYREGFIANIQPGDARGPFVDLAAEATALTSAAPSNSSTFLNFLTPPQREKLLILTKMRERLASLHKLVESDPKVAKTLSSALNSQKLQSGSPSSSTLIFKRPISDAELLKWMPTLPPLTSIHLPAANSTLTAQDLAHLTPSHERYLWLEPRYDQNQQPVLTNMFIVSKGSRKVHATADELEQVLSGRARNQWKSFAVGSVTIIQHQNGIMTATDALKRGVGGEILCVAQ